MSASTSCWLAVWYLNIMTNLSFLRYVCLYANISVLIDKPVHDSFLAFGGCGQRPGVRTKPTICFLMKFQQRMVMERQCIQEEVQIGTCPPNIVPPQILRTYFLQSKSFCRSAKIHHNGEL